MYIHGFMYRHSMTYYTSLLLFHFNNRQSQVEVNIYMCISMRTLHGQVPRPTKCMMPFVAVTKKTIYIDPRTLHVAN